MTIQEACQRLGKSESTIRRWIREKKLSAIKVDGIWSISEEAIHDQSSDQSPEDSDKQWSSDVSKQLVIELRSENEYLKERIQELESSRERADQMVMQMTRQMESQQRLLEYHEDPWYRRWFRKKRMPE